MGRPLPEPEGAEFATLRELLIAREATYGDAPFLQFESDQLSFVELSVMSNRIANSLLDLGLRPGSRVVIWMRNRPEYVALLFATAKAGLVAVTLNPVVRAVDGRYLLEDSRAEAVVFGPELADCLAAVTGQTGARPHLFLLGSAPADVETRRRHGWRSFEELLRGSAQTPPGAAVTPSSPAAVIYTSGTTGPPKGVVLPQHAYVNTARWYGQYAVAAGPEDVFFTCLPLHHCNAQIFTLASALMRGSSVAMVETFSASRYFDQIRRYGATVFNFIGMMLVAISKQPQRPDDADNPARVGFGIPVPPDLGDAFERRFGVMLLEAYGATETACGFVFNTVEERRLGRAGKVMPYAEAAILDDHGNPVPAGTVGRIAMRPLRPDIWMLDYQGKPEQTAKAWQSGWLQLGDHGVMDDAGWLAFRGRGLDWIRRRGENISAIELEDTCDQHPGVAKCAVIGVTSELTEEEVKLFVEWKPGADRDIDGLVAWLAERLADYKLPAYVQTVPELPRTATGKMAKFRLDRNPGAEWVAPSGAERRHRAGHSHRAVD
ncbi:MAG TPA: AMP-binding protein [Streptosporangiaceae bacterium]|nr:AMP-binding protein [Streptosporangiaceae bacterium]